MPLLHTRFQLRRILVLKQFKICFYYVYFPVSFNNQAEGTKLRTLHIEKVLGGLLPNYFVKKSKLINNDLTCSPTEFHYYLNHGIPLDHKLGVSKDY